MPYSPDKAYQAAQVYAARKIVSKIKEEVIVLQEAQFFVDVDTMRDIVDPQGAAACVHHLLGEEIPDELMQDPNVVGLVDEFEHMANISTASLAVQTLFQNRRFHDLLREAIQELQDEFGETAGETPAALQRYYDGEVLVSQISQEGGQR
jgi:hypothetical protein